MLLRPEIPRAHSSNPALDGLRAISILLVMATHMLPLGPKLWRLNENAGAMGMSLFFALSGYLIMKTLQRDSVHDFAVKRLARILPLAWLYMAFVALFLHQPINVIFAEVGFYLNYLPELNSPLTAHLWSLCVEVHFYAVIALVAAYDRKCLILVWPCCLAITAIRVAAQAHIEIGTHVRVDEILIGACIATLPLHSKIPGRRAVWLWFGAVVLWVVTAHPQSGWLQYLRPYAAGLLLAATLAQPRNRLAAIFGTRALHYIATISYGLYVLHPATIYGWWNEGNWAERYLLKRPISFAAAFAMAHISTFYWERPWLQFAQRWRRRRRVVAAQ